MKDDKYTEEELRAKEEAYREYLRLREEAPKVSITETPYGASQLRKKQKQDEEARRAYMQEREPKRSGKRPKKSSGSSRRSSDAQRRTRREPGRETGREDAVRRESRPSEGRPRAQEPRRRKKSQSRLPKIPIGKSRSNQVDEADRPMAENPVMTSEAARRRRKNAARKPLKTRRRRKVMGIAFIILAVLLALFLGTFVVVANTLSSVGSLDMEKNNLAISKQGKKTLKDYKNIAILGVDSRNMEDDSESRSDATIILSINKKTNEVQMFSVFRDTMLDLGEDHGLDKLTHAYSYGGAELTVAALNRNLDLNISKAVVINWKTVAEVIDALGGIEIDVQESEIEELNKYIGGTAKATGDEKVEIEHAGKQTLNGAQAVTYARIRQDAATGDYRRNERMKIVMATTFKKAKNANIFTLKKICDNALPQAKTNLGTTEMMGMALNFKKYDMTSSTTGWPYDVEGWIGTAGGGAAWYGPPVTLESNVIKLFDEFFGIKDYEPTVEVQNISNDISELTGLY